MKKLSSLLSLIILSGCIGSWGPHDLTLNVVEGVTLTNRKGEVVEFASETQSNLVATYSGSKKTLTLSQASPAQKFDFKGVVFNKTDNSLTGDQLSTGQNVEIFIQRSLASETVNTREHWRSCTYYEQRRYETCYPDNHGHVRCNTHWEQIPVRGQELVRVETTVRNYTLTGRLAQSIGTLAQLNGNYADTDHDVTSLSMCR
jgi:hypothetical protein